MHSHWQKQGSEPLFPNLLWAQPETKTTAGKLLIIGGTGQGFAGVAEAYQEAEKAGIGTARVILPYSLKKIVGKLFPGAEFAPSTPSGSFAASALAEFLDASSWAESVIIAADTGNNSETAQLFETFLTGHTDQDLFRMSSRTKPRDLFIDQEDLSTTPNGSSKSDREKRQFQVTLCGDCINSFLANPSIILDQPETTLVLTFDQLQKLAGGAHHPEAFTSDMGLLLLVERLHGFNKLHQAHLIVTYENTVAVAADGHISTTDRSDRPGTNTLAAHAATWWLQNQDNPYAALTTSILRS